MSLSLSLSLYATNLCIFHLLLTYLALSCLILSWCEWTSITIVIIGMTLYELVLHYIIISYHISCSYILSLLLIWYPFHSILFYSTLFQIDSILFHFIEFDLLYCSVLYVISMNDLCLSVRPSVCLSVCLSVWISLCFLFSPVSLFFLYPFFFFSLFIFIFLSLLFSHERLPHTHTRTRTRTHTYIWIYVPSYDSYILLQKPVSEESYSSDSIISYLI